MNRYGYVYSRLQHPIMVSGRRGSRHTRVYLYVKLCCHYFRNAYKTGYPFQNSNAPNRKKKILDYHISVGCLTLLYTLVCPQYLTFPPHCDAEPILSYFSWVLATYMLLVSHLTVFSPQTATRGLVASRKMAVNKPSMTWDMRVDLYFFVVAHGCLFALMISIIKKISIAFSFCCILSTTNMNVCLF